MLLVFGFPPPLHHFLPPDRPPGWRPSSSHPPAFLLCSRLEYLTAARSSRWSADVKVEAASINMNFLFDGSSQVLHLTRCRQSQGPPMSEGRRHEGHQRSNSTAHTHTDMFATHHTHTHHPNLTKMTVTFRKWEKLPCKSDKFCTYLSSHLLFQPSSRLSQRDTIPDGFRCAHKLSEWKSFLQP